MNNQELNNIISKLNSLKEKIISLNDNLSLNIDTLTIININNYLNNKLISINNIISNIETLKILTGYLNDLNTTNLSLTTIATSIYTLTKQDDHDTNELTNLQQEEKKLKQTQSNLSSKIDKLLN